MSYLLMSFNLFLVLLKKSWVVNWKISRMSKDIIWLIIKIITKKNISYSSTVLSFFCFFFFFFAPWFLKGCFVFWKLCVVSLVCLFFWIGFLSGWQLAAFIYWSHKITIPYSGGRVGNGNNFKSPSVRAAGTNWTCTRSV